jgi:hypothetical protein
VRGAISPTIFGETVWEDSGEFGRFWEILRKIGENPIF